MANSVGVKCKVWC